jgi:hypothetical protein
MKRKEFLISAGILGAAPFVSGMSTTKKDQKSPNQYVELIRYHLHPGEKKSLVSDFYKDVAIPALNRIGIPQVGVFTPVYGPDNLTLFVLVPHASLDAVYSDNEKLMQDKVYLKDDAAKAQFLADNPNHKKDFQRLKGLGEMDWEELQETTMDPEKRSLLRVTVEQAALADEVMSILMGDDVESRKHFITSNAKDVRFLDI